MNKWAWELFNNHIDRLPKEIPDNRWPEKVMKVMWEWAECLRITAEIIWDTQMMIKDQRMLLKQIINMEKLVEFMEKSKKWFRMIESDNHPEYIEILKNINKIIDWIEKIKLHKDFTWIKEARQQKLIILSNKIKFISKNIDI